MLAPDLTAIIHKITPRTHLALLAASPNLVPHVPQLYPPLHGVIKTPWYLARGCLLAMQKRLEHRH